MKRSTAGWWIALAGIAAGLVGSVVAVGDTPVLRAKAHPAAVRAADNRPPATPSATPALPWVVSIRKADAALARREFGAALTAANDAYGAALASRTWEGMLAVGDAYRRVGDAASLHRSFDAKAREVYLAALFRARQQGSVDGVLRTAEAFVALGDTEVAARCLRIAERLAAQNPDAQADVRAFAARLGDLTLAVQPH